MNKNAIQKYAIWARNELIEQIKQRAYQYGIDEKGYGDENADSIPGHVFTPDEKRQRKTFIQRIETLTKSNTQNPNPYATAYTAAIEEVAYTWFNRFVALRFMEVNDYLPTHIRVFTDANGAFKPEILRDVLHIDLPGIDKEKITEYINANVTDDLYRYLLLVQCNALNEALPEMFEEMGSYTEMLLPNNILRQDSVLERLVTDIPEEDWLDAVQIIGWMYQYYNTEPKQAVFDGLKKNVKITKDKIPAATQLFTPDWIVRYMVENSLGRIYVGSRIWDVGTNFSEAERIEKEKEIANEMGWKYYLPEAEQTPEVRAKLDKLNSESYPLNPNELKIIDPCMGSGHILVYAFDVLMQIYRTAGYSDRDAVTLILENNLFGLDIDKRAYQLAYFAMMMKARQYNRRIFTENVKPQVYHPMGWSDGEEYGSLLKFSGEDLAIGDKPDKFLPDGETYNQAYDDELRIWNFKRLLSQKYDVVVTNPPYMGGKGQSASIAKFLAEKFSDVKSDTFSAFIVRCSEMAKSNGYIGMFTPYVWMFIKRYEKLRNLIYTTQSINSLIQFEYSAFEEATVPVCTFVLRNNRNSKMGQYVRLVDYRGGMEVQRKKYLEAVDNPSCGFRYAANSDNFAKIPGIPVAYWVSKAMLRAFESPRLADVCETRKGLATSDNNRFLRLWFEVSTSNISFDCLSNDESKVCERKWFPINKGGEFRRFYGNNEYIINWENDGNEIRNFRDNDGKLLSRPQNLAYNFKQAITWTKITSALFSSRICFGASLFDDAAAICYHDDIDILLYVMGFQNTKLCNSFLKIYNPTMNIQIGDIGNLPITTVHSEKAFVISIVTKNIALSRTDWDSFETSWDFKRHPIVVLGNSTPPLVDYKDLWKTEPLSTYIEHTQYGEVQRSYDEPHRKIEFAFLDWERFTDTQFQTLKANEEELNRIFIDIYGLQDELTPEVDEKDVTVRRADLGREIRSLISYAVGCMFGRYSLDVEGLAFAGGDWDAAKYTTVIPDNDNIIAISDDEYIEDDIFERFIDFLRKVYGAETLEENLSYIADALGGKGTPREVIRNYFLNGFYKDHCKIYQRRPIYWLFDSGKKNGFKALMYLHRYSRDQLAKLRTEYVHEQQERYRTQLVHIGESFASASGAERARLTKQQNKLTEQLYEISVFEEKVHHLADMQIEIDLDDGVKRNYELFADVLAKI
ncbi:MAG: BREX-1 system adenine-specific DNA-methyltransferase PglX [Oscillospiraceae bacterium]|nr:BREX-1 system adenine-specific DNA-methyltransferase PglX [Oscillospiraceae bacterium]